MRSRRPPDRSPHWRRQQQRLTHASQPAAPAPLRAAAGLQNTKESISNAQAWALANVAHSRGLAALMAQRARAILREQPPQPDGARPGALAARTSPSPPLQ